MKEEIISKIKGLRLLVLGDVMLDKYVEGVVNRKSPEAPIPILEKQKSYAKLGGAANVALNLHNLGIDVKLISVVGNDNEGNEINDLLDSKGINYLILNDPNRKTTVKNRFITENEQLLRVDYEDTHNISSKGQISIVEDCKNELDSGNVTGVVFSDYDKGFLTPNMIHQIIAYAKEKQLPTYVDPKYKNYWEYKYCTLFKPNKSELLNSVDNSIEFEDAMLVTKSKLNCNTLVCTRSSEGLSYLLVDSKIQHIETTVNEVTDVSGAGDTALSVLTLADQLGIDPYISGHLTNILGGYACQNMGVNPVNFDIFYSKLSLLLKG